MARPLRVLLVDDDDVTLEELGECLAGAGLACITAPGGPSARQKIDADDDIGVLVTDLNMPGEDGLSLMRYCNRKRQGGNQMKVILMTGGASLGSAIEAVREGAFDYVTKPTEPAKLIDTVHRACAAAAAERVTASMGGLIADMEAQRTDLSVQLESALQRLDRGGSRDEFLMMMSHELRTPLNPIIGFAEFMRDHAEDLTPSTVKDYAADVLIAGQRLLRLVERMLQFAALRRGDLKPQRHRWRMSDVMEFSAQSLRGRGEGIDRVTWPGSGVSRATIHVDARMLADALTELVANALLFGKEGGPVTVSSEIRDGMLSIGVRDEGPGMSAAQIERALRPFEQLDMSMARRVEGTGIGLPLAKQIAIAHGGGLDLACQPPGMRATLSIPLDRDEILTAGTA